jgi:hypothetical protein
VTTLLYKVLAIPCAELLPFKMAIKKRDAAYLAYFVVHLVAMLCKYLFLIQGSACIEVPWWVL